MRKFRTITAIVGIAVGLVLASQAQAVAGHQHSVQTANSPTTGQPIAGGGTWITNRADYYYLGRLMPGSTFDNEVTDGNNWHYGRAFGNVNMCGWAMPGSLGTARGDVADSCSTAVESQLRHRTYIGKDFNAGAHLATGGTSVASNPGCGLYYNYFYGSDFTSNGGHAADYAGLVGTSVDYRFTTRDGVAAVVRDAVLGWGFVNVNCVIRPATLYNDDDV